MTSETLPVESTATPPAPPRKDRWSPGDLASVKVWLLTRAVTFMVVAAGAWLFQQQESSKQPPSWSERWTQWDTVHFVTIAHWGYGGDPKTGPQVPLEAFFPGFPLAMRWFHWLFGTGFVLSGMIISFIAGAVAVVALSRIAALEAGERGHELSERTVLLFLLAPSAIFLTAAYTEALFLAFALPAWLAAKRGNWWLAGLLGFGAGLTRITGLFLGVALVVEFLFAGHRRKWLQAPALVGPFAAVGAYFAYLHHRTGDWHRWQHAQEEGWFRTFHWPWEATKITWDNAFHHRQTSGFAWMFIAEMIAVAVGIGLTLWLLRKRRWAEAVFIALQLYAFTTGSWFFSVPRSTLLWWPLWTGLAAWSLKRPAVLTGYLAFLAPFSIMFALLFSSGRWAG